jgi:hypothetical protein
VTVRGEAVVPGEPDEALVFLEITAVEKTPQRAMADASERSAKLQAIFAELGIDDAARSTSGISLVDETEWESKSGRRKHVGFRASNRITIRLHDAETVGRLVSEATARCEAIVRGPSWQIALANPARARAFRAAAEDARRKAEAYASALGVTLGDVLTVIEPGLAVRVHQQHDIRPAAPAPQAAAAPPREIQVEAGALDIPAAVEVTFALEQR